MSDIPSKPLKIEGLINKIEPVMETLGTFKLKDRVGRNAVQIDLSKASRPLTDAKNLFIVKEAGSNNKIKVVIEWKPKLEVKKEEKNEQISQ